jgi:hypothetical protein
MKINFLTDYPAAFITEKKTLVIAELHLGIEHDLYKKGIVIPPQRENFQKTIDNLIELTKAKTLIILGDIKHKVPGISLREERELPKFLDYLKERIGTILVKGNHDAEIEEIVPEGIKVYGGRGFKLGKYGFFHGHAWPSKKLMQCDYLFMAHLHPALNFRDKFGFRNVEQVWVKGKLDVEKVKEKYKIKRTGKLNVIVMPTFNKLLGNIDMSKLIEREYNSVIMNKLMNMKKSKIYLLDGTLLGSLGQLKV